MGRNGQTSAGKTRWRCKTCGASSVQHRPDITRRAQAEAFAAWLLGPVPQHSTGGTGRSFRAQTAWCWNIEIPQPAPTGEVHPVAGGQLYVLVYERVFLCGQVLGGLVQGLSSNPL